MLLPLPVPTFLEPVGGSKFRICIQYIYTKTINFITFNMKYLASELYSVEYRSKRILQMITFCFIQVLHSVSTILELNFVCFHSNLQQKNNLREGGTRSHFPEGKCHVVFPGIPGSRDPGIKP